MGLDLFVVHSWMNKYAYQLHIEQKNTQISQSYQCDIITQKEQHLTKEQLSQPYTCHIVCKKRSTLHNHFLNPTPMTTRSLYIIQCVYTYTVYIYLYVCRRMLYHCLRCVRRWADAEVEKGQRALQETDEKYQHLGASRTDGAGCHRALSPCSFQEQKIHKFLCFLPNSLQIALVLKESFQVERPQRCFHVRSDPRNWLKDGL